MRKCKTCGKEFEPEKSVYTECPECHAKKVKTNMKPHDRKQNYQSSRASGSGQSKRDELELPKELILDSFMDAGAYKFELYCSLADKAQHFFTTQAKPALTQTAMRRIFQKCKDAELLFKRQPERFKSEITRICGEILTYAIHQANREIVSQTFREFIEKHLEVMRKSEEEFFGFVAYLTAIMVRLKQRNR